MSFSKERLEKQPNLFAHRSALYFTPTNNLPRENVGSGSLDITLPIPTPDYTDYWELNSYKSPKMWVDLIQRQTQKIRWTPMNPATIILTRYDAWNIRQDHLSPGIKALIDAFKVKTTGRKDKRYLFYFGAILDDGPNFAEVKVNQAIVEHPRLACIRVQIQNRTAAFS